MELSYLENGIRVLTPAIGKRIALATTPDAPYDGEIYLGKGDNSERYIEIDAPEPEEEPSE